MLLFRETGGKEWNVPAGGAAAGFVEGETYIVHVDRIDARILIDDVPLERQLGQNAFIWRPGFYAGQVIAEVLDDQERVLGSCVLDIGPSPGKIGGPQFQHMVMEILAFRPELLLGDGATLPEFGHEADCVSHEVAYARLRRYGPAVLAALRAVCASPLTRLHLQRRTVMPHQARRLDVPAVRQLARSRFAGHVLGLEVASAETLARISVPYTEHTFDNAANRVIAAMVDRLVARTSELFRYFSNTASDVESPMALKSPRRLHLLSMFHDALRRLQNSAVLSEVTRSEITAAGLNAISAQPGYAHAYQQAWKVLRTGILGDDHDEPLPISPTWEVFERWCFLRIWQILEEVSPHAGWAALPKDGSTSKIAVQGVVSDSTVTIHLQPSFPAWDQSSASGFKSLSQRREPDLVVTIESPRGRSFLVLDAKYRTSRANVLDAMQSAHIYRDSLRWRGEHPWGSYLLLPRHGAAEWLAQPSFHNEFKVGTFELAPVGSALQLQKLLTEFLAHLCSFGSN